MIPWQIWGYEGKYCVFHLQVTSPAFMSFAHQFQLLDVTDWSKVVLETKTVL